MRNYAWAVEAEDNRQSGSWFAIAIYFSREEARFKARAFRLQSFANFRVRKYVRAEK